jgi:hypothetical protein
MRGEHTMTLINGVHSIVVDTDSEGFVTLAVHTLAVHEARPDNMKRRLVSLILAPNEAKELVARLLGVV